MCRVCYGFITGRSSKIPRVYAACYGVTGPAPLEGGTPIHPRSRPIVPPFGCFWIILKLNLRHPAAKTSIFSLVASSGLCVLAPMHSVVFSTAGLVARSASGSILSAPIRAHPRLIRQLRPIRCCLLREPYNPGWPAGTQFLFHLSCQRL